MDCDKSDCVHYKVCEEWKSLGNDNYINDSYGNCDFYSAPCSPTGDLISREALKENGTVIAIVNGEKMKVVPVKCINNAQPVEAYPFEQVQELVKLNQQFAQEIENLKRSQGMWLKVKEDRMSIDMSGELVTRYKCSKCGRLIATLPSKLVDYPYCHCGAKMENAENV